MSISCCIGVLDVIAQVDLLEIDEEKLLDFIDSFQGGSAPREVSEVRMNAPHAHVQS